MRYSAVFTSPLLLLCAIILLVVVDAGGRCVKLQDYNTILGWNANVGSQGLRRQMCSSVLSDLYTEFWADDADFDLLTNPTSCEAKVGLAIDDEKVRPLTNTFTEAGPSSTCQKVLLLQTCLYYYPPCNSTIDITSHITKDDPARKPCRWLCEAIRDEGDLCTKADFEYLAIYGIDIHDATILPQFECSNDDVFNNDESTCLTKNILSTVVPSSRCESYTGTVCTFYGSTSTVYVEGAFTQPELEVLLSAQLQFFNSFPVGSQCLDDFLRTSCMNIFPECINSNQIVRTTSPDGQTYTDKRVTRPMMLRPPTSTCTGALLYCQQTEFYQYLSGLGSQLVIQNCTTQTTYLYDRCLVTQPAVYRNYLSQYEYQTIQSRLPNKNMTIFGQTYAGDYFDIIPDIPYIDCPKPLVVAQEGKSDTVNIFGGRCTQSCPYGVFSPDERRMIIITTRVLSTIVLFTSILLSLSFVIFKSQRHKTIMFWYCLSYTFVPLVICISSFVADYHYNFQCDSPSTRYHFTGFALWVGLFAVYFYLTSCFWWLISAVNLFLRLILGRQYKRGTVHTRRLEIAHHIFAWGGPLLSIIPLCLTEYIGYDGYLPFAFLTVDPQIKTNSILPMQWFFFFFPVVLCAALGFLFVGIIFVFLVKYEQSSPEVAPTDGMMGSPDQNATTIANTDHTTTADAIAAAAVVAAAAPDAQATSGNQNNRMLARYQKDIGSNRSFFYKIRSSFKLFGFILIMLVQIIFFLAYEVTKGKNQTQYDDAMFDYQRCLMLRPASSCILASSLSPSLIVVGVVSLLIPGYAMFFLYFIFSNDLYKLWCGLLYYRLGLTWFESWASEDTSTDTHTESSSGSNSRPGSSQHSTDLLTSDGIALRRRKKGDHQSDADSNISATPGDGHKSNHLPDDDRHRYSRGTSPPPSGDLIFVDKKAVKQHQERRKQMFKGFKANQPVRKQTLQEEISPQTSTAASRPGVIELGVIATRPVSLSSPSVTYIPSPMSANQPPFAPLDNRTYLDVNNSTSDCNLDNALITEGDEYNSDQEDRF